MLEFDVFKIIMHFFLDGLNVFVCRLMCVLYQWRDNVQVNIFVLPHTLNLAMFRVVYF